MSIVLCLLARSLREIDDKEEQASKGPSFTVPAADSRFLPIVSILVGNSTCVKDEHL